MKGGWKRGQGSVGHAEEDNQPGSGDVELDVMIERNDIVQGCLAEEQDESPANLEKNEDDTKMEDECSSTGNC